MLILVSATLGDLPQKKYSKLIALIVDILAILTTIFGLVGTIGLGTTQINGGLNHLYRNLITDSVGRIIIGHFGWLGVRLQEFLLLVFHKAEPFDKCF